MIVKDNDMDCRDLQVFLSVSKHLNYTRAGEELNLSQPSVSVRIRQVSASVSDGPLRSQYRQRVCLSGNRAKRQSRRLANNLPVSVSLGVDSLQHKTEIRVFVSVPRQSGVRIKRRFGQDKTRNSQALCDVTMQPTGPQSFDHHFNSMLFGS
jgi:hypothetical protein